LVLSFSSINLQANYKGAFTAIIMNRFYRFLFSISSAILLSFGWYEWGSGLLLLIAFIPLLILEESMVNTSTVPVNSKVYFFAFFTLLVWNIATTWWVKNASFAGMLTAITVTSFFMAIPIVLYSAIKRRLGRISGYFALIISWIAFEFAYTHGEISWPWLTLGNGFMFDIKLVQWYEYTGVFGGSLWILIVNILLFEIISQYRKNIPFRNQRGLIITAFAVILIPISISLIIFKTYSEISDPREIVIVQPNIDPYLKFNDIPPLEQTQIQIDEAAKMTTKSTDYVVCPETSIMNNIWIGQFDLIPDFKMVKAFVMQNPGLNYVTGIMCYQRYDMTNRTPTSNPMGNTGLFFDSYNSAIQIDSTDYIPIYHKSMLVTGVEKMPYPKYFKLLETLTLRLGGTFRSHATQKERAVFQSAGDNIKIAPVICYESVYGEFVGDYIKKGADYIFVITNDGWWGNTPGHRQHNALSSLRAIETRRSIARSANTGISSAIDQRGVVLQELTWWKRGAIREKLNANKVLTFYVKHGDYIGRFAFYLIWPLLLVLMYCRIRNLRPVEMKKNKY
jgi:apolipoprotein N-acyltransferase